MNATPTYQQAVQAIRTTAEATQTTLDAAAVSARAACVAGLRALALQDIAPDSPAYPVAALLAQTITVGRDDGYPEITIPETTRAVLRAAIAAGIIAKDDGYVQLGQLSLHRDCSGLYNKPACWDADFDAWDRASTYRSAQTWSAL